MTITTLNSIQEDVKTQLNLGNAAVHNFRLLFSDLNTWKTKLCRSKIVSATVMGAKLGSLLYG
jgi:hypothetical protein